MLLVLLLHACVGFGLAILMLCVPGCRRQIDRVAGNISMDIGYARIVWLGGTIVAWPVGLYVLASGRLVLVDDETGMASAAEVVNETKRNEDALGGGTQRSSPSA